MTTKLTKAEKRVLDALAAGATLLPLRHEASALLYIPGDHREHWVRKATTSVMFAKGLLVHDVDRSGSGIYSAATCRDCGRVRDTANYRMADTGYDGLCSDCVGDS